MRWGIGRPWKGLYEQGRYTIVDTIKTAIISGERVEIRGFASFSLRSYKPYKGRNLKNGEIVEVPAKKLPYFEVGKELREILWKNH